MRILGVETSCDETAIAVVEVNKKGEFSVLSNIVSSQVKLHAKYGGVVPNLAAREHVKNISHVLKLALKETGVQRAPLYTKDIDLIAVTKGPGLGPALLVGITFAKTLAWKYGKPIVGVNHMEGHVYSNWLKPIREFLISNLQFTNKTFPILNLIVSGGHTELVVMRKHGDYKIVGETLDDAVGEAFDKVARLLGLGYPGGPAISQRAEKWKSEARNPKPETNSKSQIPNIKFPRPMINSKDFNFSYSGLKTAVLYKIKELKDKKIKLTEKLISQICYEFQEAAMEILIKKTEQAAQKYKVKSICLSGGVSANKLLREKLSQMATENGWHYSQPEMAYTTDNAAMIAVAGYFSSKKSRQLSWRAVEMNANLHL